LIRRAPQRQKRVHDPGRAHRERPGPRHAVTLGRGQFNATNEIVATLGAIRANTGQLLDDETHILAAIAALPSIQFPADQIPVLAAAIANDIGTPVDEEKLATALSHDVIASLGAALSNG
jgi:hypothetical protein